MQYVPIGTTGVRVSQLCMGCMTFGSEADATVSAALYHRARDAGINFFDTADVYGDGRSEEILGQLMAGARDELVIATKGYAPTGSDVNARGASRFHLVRAVEASLRRLGCERIDIYYLHVHDPHTALEDTLRTLDDLIRAGKILYPAISNFAAWQGMKALGIARAMGFAPIVAFQPMYNLVKRQAEVEILPMCRAENLAVFPYNPTGAGLLSGKYGTGVRPDSGRLVDRDMYARRYGEERYFEIADRFCAAAAGRGVHPVTLALAWVASHPAVTAPIAGARNVEQLDTALASIELTLDEAERAELASLSPNPPPATDRSEGTYNYFGAR